MNNISPHPCKIIYACSNKPVYGDIAGICRITGENSKGLLFNKWVKDTFTDLGYLKPGNIISNEALFCFDEASAVLQEKTGKDKLQRFRNYSHFVLNGEWFIKDKGQKEDMMNILLQCPEICVISESGQRHLVFKHQPGNWQYEDISIQPDIALFSFLQSRIHQMSGTFSNDEIKSGGYLQYRIIKFGFTAWKKIEDEIKPYRGAALFDLALFFSKINYNYE